MKLHPLLLRQLKRLSIDVETPPAAACWSELLQRVSRAYDEHEQESRLLERSQDLASQEMATLYATLRADKDQLESRVRERTEELRLSESRLSSLLSLSTDWIWEQDADLKFTYVSDGIHASTGMRPSQFLGRSRLTDGVFNVTPEALANYQASIEARSAFREFTYGWTRGDGVQRFVRISGEPVFDEDGTFLGYRGVGCDVTNVALAELKVQELACFDSLTGLPNRNMFFAELDRTVARARRTGQGFAVCYIDLDRFKTINDTLGHDAGDELLKVMASRLRDALREADMVARLGGDEFVAVLEGGAGTDEISGVAQKMLATIGEPLVLQGREFDVTGSIGIGMFPSDGEDGASLLKHADAAMYLAKERGKNNFQFYTAELDEVTARKFAMESQLRSAIARDELVLHYQPKVDIASGAMHSVEALVRWAHPLRGLVAPGDFIALAEERGLIVPLGRWVMQAACRQMQGWRSAGLLVPSVAINLSARQFASDTLLDDLVDALALYGIAASEFEVELTESVLMADPERACRVLEQMHAMGVSISIDDFGTGYSSLSYLKRVPAQTVKIDRSFISGLPDNKDDAAITQAVIAMAHSLGLGVVAEGVETDAQLQMLRHMGCDEAQGYLLGRPLPAAELALRLVQAPPLGGAEISTAPPDAQTPGHTVCRR